MESTTQQPALAVTALSACYAIQAAADQAQVERALLDAIALLDDAPGATIIRRSRIGWHAADGERRTPTDWLDRVAQRREPHATGPGTPPAGLYAPLADDLMLFLPAPAIASDDQHEPARLLVEHAALAIARLRNAQAQAGADRPPFPHLIGAVSERYKVLTEHTINAVLISNDDGIIFQANKAAAAIFGYPPEQLVNLNISHALGISTQYLRDSLSDYYDDGYGGGIARIRRPDGETREVEYVICRIEDNLHISILHDITYPQEQSRPPRSSQSVEIHYGLPQSLTRWPHSEERYRMLMDTSPSAILLAAADGTINFCNSQAATLFGYAPVEAIHGMNISALIDGEPGSGGQIIADIQSGHSIEYVMRRKDSQRFYADVSCTPMPLPPEATPTLIIVVHDISIRKQAERLLTAAYNDVASRNRHLNHTQRLLQDLFNGLEDGLLLLDRHGQVQVINRTLANLLGIAPELALDRPWPEVYQQASPSFPGHLAQQLSTVGRQRAQHNRYTAPDGVTRILDIRVTAIGQARQINHIIMHVIDETETVRLQEQLIRTEHFAASGKLAASVAHEINTPLQTIQTNLKLMQRMAPKDSQGFLDDALEEIRRLGRIVRQLLDFYRPTTMLVAPVDVAALIDRVMLMLGKTIRDQHIVIERQIDSDLPFIYGRADELTQIVINLIINALDVMPQGGRLGVRVELAPDADSAGAERMVIAITDSGPGLPQGLREQIFEPFITTKEQGTGLGLWISRQLVQQHGGTLWATDRPGQGSTFWVALPISTTPTRRGGT
ncbi:PAS domain S-box protein [Chloroflexia bacterium SDU3-3]|nr:PAS domain S-box protein [Chloroflexia bacterium SDU3-3]